MLTAESVFWRPGGARPVLDGVNLRLERGEILSLLGPSGCGKTSLLRVLMGLQTPDRGKVVFAGRTLVEDGREKVPARQRPFAFLFQDFTLFPHLNVKRNILLGMKGEGRGDRLEALGGLLGLSGLWRRHIHDLSGGEQQRVALARTLAMEPEVLLLDEPFSNLDGMTKQALYREIKSILHAKGISAVLATHDREEAFYFSDRMIVMSEGGIRADGPPRELYRCPETAWLARFTGEALLGTAEEMARWTGERPAEEGECFLLRPEDLRIRKGGNAEVKAVEFYGGFSTVEVETPDRKRIRITELGPPGVEPGERVSVSAGRTPFPLSP